MVKVMDGIMVTTPACQTNKDRRAYDDSPCDVVYFFLKFRLVVSGGTSSARGDAGTSPADHKEEGTSICEEAVPPCAPIATARYPLCDSY